jgi:hypothetical protein
LDTSWRFVALGYGVAQHLGDAPVKEHRRNTFGDGFEGRDRAFQRQVAVSHPIAVMGGVPADRRLRLQDLTRSLVDAEEPSVTERLQYGGLPGARAAGEDVEVRSLEDHRVTPNSA